MHPATRPQALPLRPIARHRAKRLYGLVWESGSADAPFHARHHQVIVSVGVHFALVAAESGRVYDEDDLLFAQGAIVEFGSAPDRIVGST